MPQQPPFALGSQNTTLGTLDEMLFRKWKEQNRVPFDVAAPTSDYDMRGFWQAMRNGAPMAQHAGVDPNDGLMHYPDYFKNPGHETFSNESQWAGSAAPGWNAQDQLVSPGGRIVFDDRNRPTDIASFFGGQNVRR